jgi:hypothetical protein
LKPDSPLTRAGISPEAYLAAVRLVTDNSRSGSRVNPSPLWLKALDEIERPAPAFVPLRQGRGYQGRASRARHEPGAFPTQADAN